MHHESLKHGKELRGALMGNKHLRKIIGRFIIGSSLATASPWQVCEATQRWIAMSGASRRCRLNGEFTSKATAANAAAAEAAKTGQAGKTEDLASGICADTHDQSAKR
jgi:hypothetical protein